MKFGMRKPNLKSRFKARTVGKWTRRVKRAVNPFYGKKGMGIFHPKRALYNKIYKKTTFRIGLPKLSTKSRKKSVKRKSRPAHTGSKRPAAQTQDTSAIMNIFRPRSITYADGAEYNKNNLLIPAVIAAFLGLGFFAGHKIIAIAFFALSVFLIYGWRQDVAIHEDASDLNEQYLDGRISVISGWGFVKEDVSGENAGEYEELCGDNIQQYYAWVQEAEKQPGFQHPTRVEAFEYLAMLYEKQDRIEEAVRVCEAAISAGVTDDETVSGMSGRLDRMNRMLVNAAKEEL